MSLKDAKIQERTYPMGTRATGLGCVVLMPSLNDRKVDPSIG